MNSEERIKELEIQMRTLQRSGVIWRALFILLCGGVVFYVAQASGIHSAAAGGDSVVVGNTGGAHSVITPTKITITDANGATTELSTHGLSIRHASGHQWLRLAGNSKGAAIALQSEEDGARLDLESQAKGVHLGLRSAGRKAGRGAFIEIDKGTEQPKLRIYDTADDPFPMMECTTTGCVE